MFFKQHTYVFTNINLINLFSPFRELKGKSEKIGYVLEIRPTEMSVGAIPLHAILDIKLNLADLGSH